MYKAAVEVGGIDVAECVELLELAQHSKRGCRPRLNRGRGPELASHKLAPRVDPGITAAERDAYAMEPVGVNDREQRTGLRVLARSAARMTDREGSAQVVQRCTTKAPI
jgi:hypothetical protein